MSRGLRIRPGFSFVVFLLLVFSGPLPLFSENQPGASALHGDISTKYRLRAAVGPGEQAYDHDLVQGAVLDLAGLGNGRFSIHLSADAKEDLDGNQYHTGFYPLKDLNDAWPYPVNANLYELYLDLNRPGSIIPLLRIGRQAGTRAEPFYFDGASAELRLLDRLELTVYGGLAVHFYEVEYSWASDALAGAGLDFRPSAETLLSLDYAFVEDQRAVFLGSQQYNHLLAVKLWQRLFSFLRVTADFRLLNFAPRDLRLRADNVFPGLSLEVSAGYFLQFLPQNELANEFAVYYDVIGRSEPFQSIELKAHQLLGAHLALDLGLFFRGLLSAQTEGPFNRQYLKASAGVELIDLPVAGLSVFVPGELWKAGDNAYYSTGVSVSYHRQLNGKRAAIEAGTYYSLYKYDYYDLLGELENAQTYYLKLRVPMGRYFVLQGGYEYEQGLEGFHSLNLGVRGEF